MKFIKALVIAVLAANLSACGVTAMKALISQKLLQKALALWQV